MPPEQANDPTQPSVPNQNVQNVSQPLGPAPPLSTQARPVPPIAQAKSNKKRTVLLVIGVIVGFLILLGIVATLLGYPKDSSKQSPATNSDNSDSTDKADDRLPTFSYPASVSGWTTNILDQDGITKYVSTDKSCQVTFDQAKDANGGKPTAAVSVSNYIAQVEKQLGKKVTQSDSPTITLKGYKGAETIAFIGKQMSYKGADGKDYITTVHAYDMQNLEMLIIRGCTASSWNNSQAAMTALMKEVTIVAN